MQPIYYAREQSGPLMEIRTHDLSLIDLLGQATTNRQS